MITEEQFHIIRKNGKQRNVTFMFDYEESKWIYGKWLEGYSTYELANALNCSPTTIKRTIKPFKNKKALIVPDWIKARQLNISNG